MECYKNKHMKPTKQTRGGKRPLSGRKKSDHQTTTHTFRTRVEWMEEIKQLIKDRISQLKIESESN